MTNKSGIKPVGITVLVLPDDVEQVTSSGIVVATDDRHEREQLRQTDGLVIAMSDNAYSDPQYPRRCEVGERVIMAAFAGMVRKGADGLTYRLIRDTDVVGVLVKE